MPKFPNKRAEIYFKKKTDDQVGDAEDGIGWAGLYLKPCGQGGWILVHGNNDSIEFTEYFDDGLLDKAWKVYESDFEISGEPDDEDYVIQSIGMGGMWEVTPLGQRYESDAWEDMLKEIDADMERRQFWPNVWVLNDHGNAVLLDRSKGGDS